MKRAFRALATLVFGFAMIFGTIVAGIHARQMLWAHWTEQLAHDLQGIRLGETKWESPQMNAVYDRWQHKTGIHAQFNHQLPPEAWAPVRIEAAPGVLRADLNDVLPPINVSRYLGCVVYFGFGEEMSGWPDWGRSLYLKLGGRAETVTVNLVLNGGVVTRSNLYFVVFTGVNSRDIIASVQGTDAQSIEEGWPPKPTGRAYRIEVPGSCNDLTAHYTRSTNVETVANFYDFDASCLATKRCTSQRFLFRGAWRVAARDWHIDPNAEWPYCQW